MAVSKFLLCSVRNDRILLSTCRMFELAFSRWAAIRSTLSARMSSIEEVVDSTVGWFGLLKDIGMTLMFG